MPHISVFWMLMEILVSLDRVNLPGAGASSLRQGRASTTLPAPEESQIKQGPDLLDSPANRGTGCERQSPAPIGASAHCSIPATTPGCEKTRPDVANGAAAR